jgi:hypothetical protein
MSAYTRDPCHQSTQAYAPTGWRAARTCSTTRRDIPTDLQVNSQATLRFERLDHDAGRIAPPAASNDAGVL